MRRTWAILLCLGIAGITGQPIPEKPANGSEPTGTEHQGTKSFETGVAASAMSYGRIPNHERSYEPAPYSPYPSSTCHGYAHGYYGNPNHGCRIFHVCQEDGRLETFDCPPFTKFNNFLLVCDWPHNVDYNCDPLYKNDEYPSQSHNNAYSADRSYAPSFLNLYPLPKPAYSPVAYPVLPAYSKPYAPAHHYGAKPYGYPANEHAPYKPTKLPVYEKSYDVYADKPSAYEKVYNSNEKPSGYEKVYNSYDKPVAYEKPYNSYDKPSFYEKPSSYEKVYNSYEKPVAYEKTYNSYDKPIAYEKPSGYEKVYDSYEKPVAYEKPYNSYDRPSSYEKPAAYVKVYNSYDKPVLPVYEKAYPIYEKHSYKSFADKVYGETTYEYQEKPRYQGGKVDYAKPAYDVYPKGPYVNRSYPMDGPKYSDKVAYPQSKPVYDAPPYFDAKQVYDAAYPVAPKPYNMDQKYSAEKIDYPVPVPAYENHSDKQAYPLDKPYPAFYPRQPDYPVYDADKYQDKVYPVGHPSYAPEKPSHDAYPLETPVYKAPVYSTFTVTFPLLSPKPVYVPEAQAYGPSKPVNYRQYDAPMDKPMYIPPKPISAPEYPVQKPYVAPVYPVEEPAYKAPVYEKVKPEPYAAYPNKHGKPFTAKKPEYDVYPEKQYENVPPVYNPEYNAYPEKPSKPEYQEKSYVLPLFPYNTIAADRAYADRKYVPYNQEKSYGYDKHEKFPTAAAYAAYLKNYMEHSNRYEPQYGYAPVPYVSYRPRLANLVKSY